MPWSVAGTGELVDGGSIVQAHVASSVALFREQPAPRVLSSSRGCTGERRTILAGGISVLADVFLVFRVYRRDTRKMMKT